MTYLLVHGIVNAAKDERLVVRVSSSHIEVVLGVIESLYCFVGAEEDRRTFSDGALETARCNFHMICKSVRPVLLPGYSELAPRPRPLMIHGLTAV